MFSSWREPSPGSFPPFTRLLQPSKPTRVEIQEGNPLCRWLHKATQCPQTGGDQAVGPCTARRLFPHQTHGEPGGAGSGPAPPPTAHSSFLGNCSIHRSERAPSAPSAPGVPRPGEGQARLGSWSQACPGEGDGITDLLLRGVCSDPEGHCGSGSSSTLLGGLWSESMNEVEQGVG